MNSSNILTAFNDHFLEFVQDIQNVFPEDRDILVAKNSLLAIKKANPKMIIKIWNTFIVSKYKKEIEEGDVNFFIDKDYRQDVNAIQQVQQSQQDKTNQITQAIDRLREPVKQMTPENQGKTMKYIQNLTKLACLYEK